MALFLLIVLGMSLGWFASIITRTEARRGILLQMAVGLVMSLVVGLPMNSGTVLGGVSLLAAGAAAGASIAALVAYNLFVGRGADA